VTLTRDTPRVPPDNNTEALFPEARRRRRRIRIMTITMVILVAGLVVGLVNALGTSGAPPKGSLPRAAHSEPRAVSRFVEAAQVGLRGPSPLSTEYRALIAE